MEHEPLTTPIGKKNADLWKAYKEVRDEYAAKEAALSTTAVAQAKQAGDAVEVAEAVDVAGIVASVENVVAGLQAAKGTFDELNKAIDAKKDELEEVHGIEVEVNTLVAVVDAKDRLVEERTEKAQEILRDAKEEAERIADNAHAESNSLVREAAEADALADRNRRRSEEEWQYTFQRNTKAQLDKVADNIAAQKKELAERVSEVDEREAQADEIQAKIDELTDKLEVAEVAAQERVAVAVEEAIAKTRRSEGFSKTMIEKDLNSKLAIANAKIEGLESQVADLQDRLERADSQIASANERVTNIATSAMQSGADAATIAELHKIAAGSGNKK